MKLICLAITLTIVSFTDVKGHGYLWDPPNRGSLYRPPYNIGKLYEREWTPLIEHYMFNEQPSIACGETNVTCPNGEYCNNIIVRTYKSGTTIPVVLSMFANHGGVMQFRLCPSSNGAVTWDCLEKNRLKIVEAVDQGETSNGGTIWHGDSDIDESGHVIARNSTVTLHVQLPDITCERCVFHWHWTAGDIVGTCADGTEGLGCGPQQTYLACADIKLE